MMHRNADCLPSTIKEKKNIFYKKQAQTKHTYKLSANFVVLHVYS